MKEKGVWWEKRWEIVEDMLRKRAHRELLSLVFVDEDIRVMLQDSLDGLKFIP